VKFGRRCFPGRFPDARRAIESFDGLGFEIRIDEKGILKGGGRFVVPPQGVLSVSHDEIGRRVRRRLNVPINQPYDFRVPAFTVFVDRLLKERSVCGLRTQCNGEQYSSQKQKA